MGLRCELSAPGSCLWCALAWFFCGLVFCLTWTAVCIAFQTLQELIVKLRCPMKYSSTWFKAVVFFNLGIIYLSVSILLSFEGSVNSSELGHHSFATIHYYVNFLSLFQLILIFSILSFPYFSLSVFHLTLFLESLSVIFDCLFSCFIFLYKNEKSFQSW